jgi:hypothetical protein
VEILEKNGVARPGFSRADCPEIYGDAFDQEVRWQSAAELKDLTGQTVRLRFYLRDADLYAFRFASGVRTALPGAYFEEFETKSAR